MGGRPEWLVPCPLRLRNPLRNRSDLETLPDSGFHLPVGDEEADGPGDGQRESDPLDGPTQRNVVDDSPGGGFLGVTMRHGHIPPTMFPASRAHATDLGKAQDANFGTERVSGETSRLCCVSAKHAAHGLFAGST